MITEDWKELVKASGDNSLLHPSRWLNRWARSNHIGLYEGTLSTEFDEWLAGNSLQVDSTVFDTPYQPDKKLNRLIDSLNRQSSIAGNDYRPDLLGE